MPGTVLTLTCSMADFFSAGSELLVFMGQLRLGDRQLAHGHKAGR